jgi:diguanylate cyclase (GGDEF)-like protein/PAS domain S-box-containing protein
MSADDVHIRPAARPVLAEPAGLVEHVQAGVGVVQDGRFLYVNRRLSEMLDYSARDMVGHLQAADIVHPADLALVEERIRRRHRDGVNEPYDIRILRRNGDVVDARVSGHNIQYAGAKADLVTLTDISEIKTALRAADWQARMLEQTEALCRSGSAEIDWAGRGVRLSTGLCRLLGLPESTRSLSPRAVLRRLLPGDCRSVIQSWRDAVPGQPFEFRHGVVHAGGGSLVVHQRGLLEEGGPGRAHRGVAFVQDITSQRDAELRIQQLANYDVLTGLPNRGEFLRRLRMAIQQAQIGGGEIVVLAVEIAQVRQMKQSLGFESADALAVAAAVRLSAAVGDDDQIARLGEGEFAVLVTNLRGLAVAEVVEQRARALKAALAMPEMVETSEIFLEHSVGVARFPADADNAARLLSSALAAARGAGARDGSVRLASPALDAFEHRRIALESALRHAIARQEFTLAYQPQLELRAAGCAASRPCCAGIPPCWAAFARRSSCRWRNAAARSCRSGNGCCARPAARPRRGSGPGSPTCAST